jgi:hypothetical protein
LNGRGSDNRLLMQFGRGLKREEVVDLLFLDRILDLLGLLAFIEN